MNIDIRYPKITGVTEKEQLAQIKSYLHQLVGQLAYAFSNVAEKDEIVSEVLAAIKKENGGE